MLTDTVFDIKKIADLPADVRVVHKYGVHEDKQEIVFHDCGIMYIQDMRLFYCVMTEGIPQREAKGYVGNIIHKTYVYAINARANFDQYKQTKEEEN